MRRPIAGRLAATLESPKSFGLAIISEGVAKSSHTVSMEGYALLIATAVFANPLKARTSSLRSKAISFWAAPRHMVFDLAYESRSFFRLSVVSVVFKLLNSSKAFLQKFNNITIALFATVSFAAVSIAFFSSLNLSFKLLASSTATFRLPVKGSAFRIDVSTAFTPETSPFAVFVLTTISFRLLSDERVDKSTLPPPKAVTRLLKVSKFMSLGYVV